MEVAKAAEYWESNAEAWTRHSRADYYVYRDALNTPALFGPAAAGRRTGGARYRLRRGFEYPATGSARSQNASCRNCSHFHTVAHETSPHREWPKPAKDTHPRTRALSCRWKGR